METAPDPPTPASSPVPATGEKSVRALGWLLIVLGTALTAASALFAYVIHRAVVHDSHLRWNGNPEVTRVTFLLVGALFFFGLDALVAGIFQIRTGRRNLWLLGIMVLLLLAMPLFGLILIVTAQHSR